MFPKQLIYIFGLIPIPAIFGTIIFVSLDLVGLLTQAAGSSVPIGHGAHLGGALAGFIYSRYLKLPKQFTST
jgi:membrane associated rhomboid family serine protease